MKSIKLRSWGPSDLDPYAAMNSDEEVMQYFPALMTRDESEASMKRFQQHIDEHGWGVWAVEVAGEFAGFTGLKPPRFEASFTPCIEIGWRFARKFWGQGIAFEASQRALVFGFNSLGLLEIVSLTTVGNTRSRRLMERLGFVRDPDADFDHPLIPNGHPLQRHVLYRKRR
jgi:RimJ/RimL family protein N-acetyltransferase